MICKKKKYEYEYVLKTVNKCFCGGDSFRKANASDGLICNNCGCLFWDGAMNPRAKWEKYEKN